jgi:hypothetical protein
MAAMPAGTSEMRDGRILAARTGGGDIRAARGGAGTQLGEQQRTGETTAANTIKTGPLGGGGALSRPEPVDSDAWLAQARERLVEPGEYLAYEDAHELKTVALRHEWTRIGRSLAADVRFDDPTVSRRHALVVRQADGVRVLDDRSLNGVFVNGSRIDRSGVGPRVLRDGDEIVVGRYRLRFLSIAPEPAG